MGGGKEMKHKLRDPKTIKILINKMLEKHNVDSNYVIAHPIIGGLDWFAYFTFTTKEAEEFRLWFMAFITTECSPKLNKKIAEKEYDGFNSMWGLKIQENV